MKTTFNRLVMLSALAVVFIAAKVQAAPAQVSASLDQAGIALGDSSQLTVTITGDDNAQPELPRVDGLEIAPIGQSSSFQSINGSVSSSVSLLYQVTPDRAGTFTIPSIGVRGGTSSQPLTLQVSKTAGGASASPLSNLPPPNVQPGTSDNTSGDTADANGEPAFLRAILPKRQLYVGERVPVQVKAYFRSGMGASLNGLPVLSSDAFTLNKLDDKPDQSEESVGGRPYTVLTWSTALSAVKTGDYAINLEMPVVVRVRTQGRNGGDLIQQFLANSGFPNSGSPNSGLDDSDVDDFFGGVTEKPLTLRTDSENVKVVPLPIAGRPADFNGAVGQFDVSSHATPTKLTAGDPITLHMQISGQGNFDRVSSTGLEASADWKTYSARSQFEPADSAGYGGTKTFDQAIIPLQAGRQKIPAITFCYFDPDTRQYVTRATTPIAIEAAPGAGAPSEAISPASLSTSSAQSPSTNLPAPELAPNKVGTGTFVSSLRPIVFAPWFITMQSVPVMALVGGLFVRRRRQQRANDPERTRNRAAHAAVREQLLMMEQAVASNNPPAFFTAARQAVQEELASRWQLTAGQVTSAEIELRLNGDGSNLRDLFTVADDVVYSGRRVPLAELQGWNDTVIHQLKILEQL
jgi:hypothetical protein